MNASRYHAGGTPGRGLDHAAAAFSESLLACWKECTPALVDNSMPLDCLSQCLLCILSWLPVVATLAGVSNEPAPQAAGKGMSVCIPLSVLHGT
jgi:hypothetical protein